MSAYLSQIGPMAHSSLNPYVIRGNQASVNYDPDIYLKDMMQEYSGHHAPAQSNEMATNPIEFLNRIMRGYEPSAGYRYRERQALGAARNASAAGGRVGTAQNQQETADLVREVLGQDQDQFLRNVLGIQESGLGAQERYNERRLSGRSNLSQLLAQIVANRNEARENRGYGASMGISDITGTNLGNMESLRFQNERQRMQDEARQQESRRRRRSGIAGLLGSLAGAGAGFALGGPAGASAGSSLGGRFGGFF